MQTIYGQIRKVHFKERIFEIVIHKKLKYFYLSRSQIKKFKSYLYEGLFVKFNCNDIARLHNRFFAYEVFNFIQMMRPIGKKRLLFYDSDTIKSGVRKLLKKDRYRMFLDMEFTMPPYGYVSGSGFVPEIIQYGIYLEDNEGKMVLVLDSMVRPKKLHSVNSRTLDFLNIDIGIFDTAQAPKKFYRILQDIMAMYQPVVYVWGKNDISVLERFYQMYNLKPAIERKQIINLMQVIKNYYGIKTDIGLFNAYHIFNREPVSQQDHDALHDAVATSEIFNLFLKEID